MKHLPLNIIKINRLWFIY